MSNKKLDWLLIIAVALIAYLAWKYGYWHGAGPLEDVRSTIRYGGEVPPA